MRAASYNVATRLRLITGLTMFTFVSTHLLNHSLGLISLDAMEAGRDVFLGFWRSLPGATLLLAAAGTHLLLVAGKQVRRSTLRMPWWEGLRLLLGVLTLFLLMVHGLETYGMYLRHGLEDSYAYVLTYIWPDAEWRQTLLLASAWVHGCIGVHVWGRLQSWYRRAVPVLYALALLLPMLAWLGIWAGAEEAKEVVQARRAEVQAEQETSGYGYGDSGGSGYGSAYGNGGDDPGYGSAYGDGGGDAGGYDYGDGGNSGYGGGSGYGYGDSGSGSEQAFVRTTEWGMQLLTPRGLTSRKRVQSIGMALATLLVLTVLGARGGLLLWRRRRGVVTIRYGDGRRVNVPRGTTVLEASRIAGVPHASVCGGRGRCTTCRVRVDRGREHLPEPGENERRILTRLHAPDNVRLACQLRPRGDVTLATLVPPTAGPRHAGVRNQYLFGSERHIAILFADLRGFTTLSEQRLPYDVVYLLNQYFEAMGRVIEANGGYVDKFIGDGIMALFGLHDGPNAGCRGALTAARDMGRQLDALNARLAPDLDAPLRMGIGIHTGPAIVAEMGYKRASGVTAIGDAVNVASRLEGTTKKAGVQLVVSARVAERAGVDLTAFPSRTIEVRGARQSVDVYEIPSAEDLPLDAAGSAGPAAERPAAPPA